MLTDLLKYSLNYLESALHFKFVLKEEGEKCAKLMSSEFLTAYSQYIPLKNFIIRNNKKSIHFQTIHYFKSYSQYVSHDKVLEVHRALIAYQNGLDE